MATVHARGDSSRVRLEIDSEIETLSVSPRGSILAVVRGGRAVVVPTFPTTEVDAEPIDVGDALVGIDHARVRLERVAAVWYSEPPATRWGDFLDAERVVLVGRKRVRVLSTSNAALLSECEIPDGARALSIDHDRGDLWLCTSTGFSCVRLGRST